MNAPSLDRTLDEPIQDFSQCHAGIVQKLHMLGQLPALLEPAGRARDIAEGALDFFRVAIFEHHLDEERELFPPVLASALESDERQALSALVRRLTDEHRELEDAWKRIEPGLKKVAKGQRSDIDVADVEQLVSKYIAHAQLEESEFLPRAQIILGRNSHELAALGLALHMRHTTTKIIGYV